MLNIFLILFFLLSVCSLYFIIVICKLSTCTHFTRIAKFFFFFLYSSSSSSLCKAISKQKTEQIKYPLDPFYLLQMEKGCVCVCVCVTWETFLVQINRRCRSVGMMRMGTMEECKRMRRAANSEGAAEWTKI